MSNNNNNSDNKEEDDNVPVKRSHRALPELFQRMRFPEPIYESDTEEMHPPPRESSPPHPKPSVAVEERPKLELSLGEELFPPEDYAPSSSSLLEEKAFEQVWEEVDSPDSSPSGKNSKMKKERGKLLLAPRSEEGRDGGVEASAEIGCEDRRDEKKSPAEKKKQAKPTIAPPMENMESNSASMDTEDYDDTFLMEEDIPSIFLDEVPDERMPEQAPDQDEETGLAPTVAASRRDEVIAVAEVLHEQQKPGAAVAWRSDRRTHWLVAAVVVLLIGLIVGIPLALKLPDDDNETKQASTPPPPTPSPTLQGTWAKLGEPIAGENSLEHFGYSIALSNDGMTLAAGANIANTDNGIQSGRVRVHKWTNESRWQQVGQPIDGNATEDSFGCAVALNGNGTILAVGAYLHDPPGVECCNAGHVQVYRLEQEERWVRMGQDLSGEAKADRFGISVSLSDDGSVLAVGAYRSDRVARDAGTVRVFEFFQGNWTQIGDHMDGESKGDWFGDSLALSADGNSIAIGARHNSDNGKYAGKVRVFARMPSDQWDQVGQDILGEAEGDQSGWSVSLSGDASVLAVGAPRNNGTSGENSGHVRAYGLSANGNWTQIGSDIDGEFAGDDFGRSVALSYYGNVLAAGARFNADAAVDAGHVRVFRQLEGEWIQIGSDIDGKGRNDRSGKSIALSSNGDILAIGSDGNNDGGNDSGHVRVFQLEK